MEARTPQVRKDEEKERRGGGLWLSFLKKLGLGPAYPPCAGPVSLGVSSAAPATLGLLETLIGSDAGIVAVLLAGSTAAIAVGVIGHHAFTQGPAPVEASAGPWALFPMRSRQSSQVASAAGANGASSSLDYMAEAARKDAWLRERNGVAEPATSSPASGFLSSNSRSEPSKMPPTPDTAGAAQRAMLAKSPAFGGGGGSGTGGSGASGLRDALNGKTPGAGANVYGVTAPPRNRAAAPGGRRALIGNRGARTSDMLRFANRDGLSQRGAKNPLMTAAGYTFDGAGVNRIQGSAAGTPSAESFGGIPGQQNRFSPDKVIDQKEVPGPVPVGEEEEATPYQGLMYAAIGLLLAAMLVQKFAGQKKEEAKQIPPTGVAAEAKRAALLSTAAMLHMLAAALGGGAAAIGGMIMQKYDQTAQGFMFIVSGGTLALFNLKAAMDMSKAKAEAEKAKEEALDKMGNIAQTPTDYLKNGPGYTPPTVPGGSGEGGSMQPPQMPPPSGGQGNSAKGKKPRKAPVGAGQ